MALRGRKEVIYLMNTELPLRPYQLTAIDNILLEWSRGRTSTLLVLPTGTGKTVVFSRLVKGLVEDFNERVLILAHRDELLEQAKDKLESFSGLSALKEQAENRAYESLDNTNVVVGSVQTLMNEKRLQQFDPDDFDTVIIDEAHHVLAPSYLRILNYFKEAKKLGVTATPDRTDMQDLSEVFDSLAFEYSLSDAINDGYLSPIEAMMIPIDIDFSQVRVQAGDFMASDVSHAIEPYLEEIVVQMKEQCTNRKTVIFLPLVATSQMMVELLNKHGFRACEVNGTSKNRQEILQAFEDGEYNVLCNSMLLTEGWDCPSVDCVVVLRPTKSRSLYSQMVGRGTRLYPGKENLLLLDFMWNSGRHDLCHPPDLITGDKETAQIMNEMIRKNKLGSMNIFNLKQEAEDNIQEARERKIIKKLEEAKNHKKERVNPLDYYVDFEISFSSYIPTFKWEREKPTNKQINYLKHKGIPNPKQYTRGQCSKIIDMWIERINQGLFTANQVRCLKKMGFMDVLNWKFEDASEMIDCLSKNKWKIPQGINPNTYIPKPF